MYINAMLLGLDSFPPALFIVIPTDPDIDKLPLVLIAWLVSPLKLVA